MRVRRDKHCHGALEIIVRSMQGVLQVGSRYCGEYRSEDVERSHTCASVIFYRGFLRVERVRRVGRRGRLERVGVRIEGLVSFRQTAAKRIEVIVVIIWDDASAVGAGEC